MRSPIEMRLTDEKLEELYAGGPEHGPVLGKLIEQDILEFEKWMTTSLNGPLAGALSRFERAILKTYAYWKLTKGRQVENLPKTPLKTEQVLPGSSTVFASE